ncbi:hypothetical protein M3201_07325 [Paenibacillus motobuensis]|uniref:hypothetical protein n=1 Tax=Paenibacillus TaxID=44249 RepID=UPI00203D8E92|nr:MULTISPECIES: hypothetical protein [Paenibacillus]MCM3039509.1 hypothetical protein [Paenibacillus lutimineralis]MCM3646613.1 hypothetical protein [Paenibacillus motobuensis]
MNALKNMLGYIQSILQKISVSKRLLLLDLLAVVDFMTNDSLNMTEISAAYGFNSSSYLPKPLEKYGESLQLNTEKQ